MIIQWYPGHMAKAKRMLQENLKLVDIVAEIIDARAPLASRNPDFESLFRRKGRIVLLNKADLADPEKNKQWVTYYEKLGIRAVCIASTGNSGKRLALSLMEQSAREKTEKMLEKGIRKTVRVMVVGIPNVGKSTFINRIAGESRAKTGDRPGVTKGKQWVKAGEYLELMDSPGLLWPKLENEKMAQHLAYLGSVNDEILDIEALAEGLLQELMLSYPAAVTERYPKISEGETRLEGVARSRGFLLRGGLTDTERAARIVLDEFRGGKLGRITLEVPETTPDACAAETPETTEDSEE